jgi:hypothetical protein
VCSTTVGVSGDAQMHWARCAPRVRAGRGLAGRRGAPGWAGAGDAGGTAAVRRQSRADRRGGDRGDVQYPRDRQAVGAAGREGGHLKPTEDAGDRRGEGQDRQGRRRGALPAAGRRLPAGGVGRRRSDACAAPPGRSARAHRPAAHPAEEPGPGDPAPQPDPALSRRRPVRPQGPALAGRAGVAGR